MIMKYCVPISNLNCSHHSAAHVMIGTKRMYRLASEEVSNEVPISIILPPQYKNNRVMLKRGGKTNIKHTSII